MFGTGRATKMTETTVPYRLTVSDIENIPCALQLTLKAEEKSEVDSIARSVVRFLIDATVKNEILHSLDAILNDIYSFEVESPIIYRQENFNMLPNINSFYRDNIVVSKGESIKIAKSTVEQSSCAEWYDFRKFRLSASKAYRVIVRSHSFEKLAAALVKNKKFDCPATQYGILSEKRALVEFCKMFHTKFQIVNVGVLCKLSQPWICGSPDGIIVETEVPTRKYILEIKCPYSCRKMPIFDTQTKKFNVPYLFADNDGTFQLKKSHQYYYQVQINLYVTNLDLCYFYIYSPLGSQIITVERCDVFLYNAIPRMERFYFNYFLPEVVEQNG